MSFLGKDGIDCDGLMVRDSSQTRFIRILSMNVVRILKEPPFVSTTNKMQDSSANYVAIERNREKTSQLPGK
jgi:hypothetical protein